jgi:hypothetical protein
MKAHLTRTVWRSTCQPFFKAIALFAGPFQFGFDMADFGLLVVSRFAFGWQSAEAFYLRKEEVRIDVETHWHIRDRMTALSELFDRLNFKFVGISFVTHHFSCWPKL